MFCKRKSIKPFAAEYIDTKKGWTTIKFFKAVAVLTIFSVLTRILGFVFRIYLSRTLTPELLGIYTIAVSIFMVFATALNSGLPVTVSKLCAEHAVTKDQKKLNQITTSGFLISMIITAVLLLLLFVTKPLFVLAFDNLTAYHLLITMSPALLFTGIYAPLRGYIWGKENYLQVSLVEFVEQIIRISSCFLLFLWLSDTSALMGAGISLSVACVLSTILGIVFFIASKGRFQKGNDMLLPVFKASSTITGIRVLSSLMQPLLAFLIPLRLMTYGYTQSQALGQLGIATGMTMPLLTIPGTIVGALSMAMIPKISALRKEQKSQNVISQIHTATVFTMAISFLFLPFFMGVGVPLCELLFHNSLSGEYLVHSAWLVLPMGLAQLSTSVLNSLGLEVKTFIYYIISSIFLLGCVFFLPEFVGIYALLYGLGISSCVVTILNIIKINKTIGDKTWYVKPLFILTLITLPVLALVKWGYPLLVLLFPPLVALLLIGSISVVAFALLLFISGTLKWSSFATHMPAVHQKKRKQLP